MNKLLKRLRRSYATRNGIPLDENLFSPPPVDFSGQEASDLIYEKLISDKPVMIARYGGTELGTLSNYLDMQTPVIIKPLLYIINKIDSFSWDEQYRIWMSVYSGFYPNDRKNIIKFCKLFLNDIKELDVLGAWQTRERKIKKPKRARTIPLLDLEPYYHKKPWSKALKGKKVLVIHPFEESIKNQYKIREKLFENPDVLPEFELITIKAVQTVAGNNHDAFNDWFEALEYMKNGINKTDFDIAIIGCGAYGFSLAAHVKRIGKKAVHLGGATQLLFGIIGKRWESADIYIKKFTFKNDYWVRPLESEKPNNSEKVEGSTYW
ncbi:hypothetical protein [Epilithonimonas hominis]|uniref:hypothetical protein n=1 Tax=Epilithonimonas hominis TaxID=420404 RepID=UPI002898AB02|nr:hypothetical protein [Epilithonimonas hominis]